MDCVRTAIRQGAASGELPLSPRPRQHAGLAARSAERRGGRRRVRLAVRPARLHRRRRRDRACGWPRMRLGAPDATGRQAPEEIAGADYTEPADLVIKALGFEPEDAADALGRRRSWRSPAGARSRPTSAPMDQPARASSRRATSCAARASWSGRSATAARRPTASWSFSPGGRAWRRNSRWRAAACVGRLPSRPSRRRLRSTPAIATCAGTGPARRCGGSGAAGLLLLRGGEHVRRIQSSEWAERAWCDACGSHLFYRLRAGPKAGWTYLSLGVLDEILDRDLRRRSTNGQTCQGTLSHGVNAIQIPVNTRLTIVRRIARPRRGRSCRSWDARMAPIVTRNRASACA